MRTKQQKHATSAAAAIPTAMDIMAVEEIAAGVDSPIPDPVGPPARMIEWFVTALDAEGAERRVPDWVELLLLVLVALRVKVALNDAAALVDEEKTGDAVLSGMIVSLSTLQ
jgi:hypothetical protein